MTFVQKKGEAMIDKDHHHTIIRIPDKLWNEIRLILPKEKPFKTIGRPIVPYRKVLDGRCYLQSLVLVPPVIEDSRNGINWMFSKRHGLNY